jgi:hypothetical protein
VVFVVKKSLFLLQGLLLEGGNFAIELVELVFKKYKNPFLKAVGTQKNKRANK